MLQYRAFYCSHDSLGGQNSIFVRGSIRAQTKPFARYILRAVELSFLDAAVMFATLQLLPPSPNCLSSWGPNYSAGAHVKRISLLTSFFVMQRIFMMVQSVPCIVWGCCTQSYGKPTSLLFRPASFFPWLRRRPRPVIPQGDAYASFKCPAFCSRPRPPPSPWLHPTYSRPHIVYPVHICFPFSKFALLLYIFSMAGFSPALIPVRLEPCIYSGPTGGFTGRSRRADAVSHRSP